MRKFFMMVLAVFVLCQTSRAQETPWEVGVGIGATNYLGDLVLPYWSPFQELQPSFSVQGKYQLQPEWTARLSVSYFELTGDESNYPERKARSFTFTNSIIEVAALVEWEFWNEREFEFVQRFRRRLSPYFYAGIGGILTNPMPNYGNNTVDENVPLIEQYGDQDYAPLQFVLPFGGGIKYRTVKTFYLALEWGLRIPFTDYLDGISETANPDKNDWYQQLEFSAIYRF